jgi:hypothetical protein
VDRKTWELVQMIDRSLEERRSFMRRLSDAVAKVLHDLEPTQEAVRRIDRETRARLDKVLFDYGKFAGALSPAPKKGES